MKKLEIIIRPEKLDDLKMILHDLDATGMMISNVMGHGNQMGYQQQYKSNISAINLVNKLKVEAVVKDEIVSTALIMISDSLSTGNVGDGKVFVYNVEEAMRIRTGEMGEDAL